MRALATDLAETIGLGLPEAYASRIRGVEAASLLRFAADPRNPVYSGAEALREAKRWDEIQVGQVIHDRQFHPDVFGLSKVDQLRHYTFHVAKLAGMLVDAIENEDWDGFGEMRLADIAIFGVKLSTVCNERLPESSVHRLSLESDADRLVGHLQAPRPAAR